ncbi:MAG: Hsp20/alpha crystallin family protein [Phycisphaerales bacterium]|nr:Hsp20/alpha crystallin family protein [Phycisphaerales bacterium]
MTMSLPTATHATVDTVRHEFDRVLDRLMAPAMALSMGLMDHMGVRAHPAFNIIENDDSLIIEAELPGVAAHNLDVTVTDGVLTVSGRRTTEPLDQSETTMLRHERRSMTFERSIRLPEAVHHEGMDAVLEDGVLTITLAKAHHACTRRIEVRN